MMTCDPRRSWTKVGAACPHEDANGFNVTLACVSLSDIGGRSCIGRGMLLPVWRTPSSVYATMPIIYKATSIT
jgi:hypothetical protein